MITDPAPPGATGGRIRIAISSPEIIAHIRHEFASKGLDVRIDGLPAVDVVVTPGAGAAPATGALADVLSGLAGPRSRNRDPATARYRLALVPHHRPTRAAGRLPGHAADPPRSDRRRPLSPREAQVMDGISRGMRNADIAAMLRVELKTVKNHVNRIFGKLGARNRVEAVLIWQRYRAASAR
ncbi:response regulator transcription factor [Micromonospora sp. HM5-17]|jgi:DNA-binding CsgD family transcriptional regulator|uniref:response regulator transcription factor n=1 Tax=Micromonospora sp. HM5-17 TaxID=2487710 RepID=UPI000F465BF8|nr:helix-turn-helix transcriptional regulator [Micromonospora sp. HM5-17]ROT33432.1 LuxR family transcriptional regulator [Micromonospora sp. HM5-17]